jgi:hypothetical protein
MKGAQWGGAVRLCRCLQCLTLRLTCLVLGVPHTFLMVLHLDWKGAMEVPLYHAASVLPSPFYWTIAALGGTAPLWYS